MEMTVRLLISEHIDWDDVNKYNDLAELLDKEILKICDDKSYDMDEVKRRFITTFDLLYGIVGEDVFRKIDSGKHTGPFLASAFQAIATGVFMNIDQIMSYEDKNQWILNKIENMYQEDVYMKNILPGVRAIPRFKELSVWSKEYFIK